MSGVFNDQSLVERLVPLVVNRFRWVPAWKKWLEFWGGYWRSWNAEENLQAEYRRSLAPNESATRQEKYGVANALSASAQKWVLWLLTREPRLIARPEEFDTEKPLHPAFPGVAETMGLSNLASVLSFEGNHHELGDMTLRMRACVESQPNCLLRTDYRSPDLRSLVPLLEDQLGSYVTRVDPKTWIHFPHTLSPRLAYQLTGTHVCILDGEERWQTWRKFPQVALSRWITWDRAEWTGEDGERYWLRLPRFYVVTGPAYDKGLHDGLDAYTVQIRQTERES